VNAGFLAAIKRGAVLINTARGAVVDEDSLKGALDSGRLGGAVLDVFRNEPTPSTALMDAATIVTPHVAGRTVDGMGANTVAIGEQLAVFLGSPATADLSLPDTQPLVARIGDGSMAEIVGKTWDLPLIEATLQAAEGGFREARTLAERRRDISMHRLPQSATSQQRRLHEILDSL
jgi:hypothetical protein